jgi:hypothetical protein
MPKFQLTVLSLDCNTIDTRKALHEESDRKEDSEQIVGHRESTPGNVCDDNDGDL